MNDFDKRCYDFKNNIINIFNKQENVPFLLKYYLIKQIWEQIKNHKQEIDNEYQVQKNNEDFQIEKKQISTSIDIPLAQIEKNNSKEEKEEQS